MSNLKSLFGTQDMTVCRPLSVLARFSVPLLIGNFTQQLYNTADSIIVGRYIGDTALAAVGTAGPILNLLLVLFMGIATGAGILAAQYFGAKDRETLSRTVGNTLLLTLGSGLLMSVIGFLATPFLVGLTAPPPEVADGAVIYLQIIFIGFLGGGAYNILSGVLRGMGDSVYPLIFLVIASLLNIVLDIVFVANFGMGIAGVAWATIIAQAISGMLCAVRLIRMKDLIDLNRNTLRPDGMIMRKLWGLGIPAGITSAIFSMSAILVQGLVNSMGTAVIATNVAVMRVDGFAMMPNFTFGTAATTYIGQNIGARKTSRLRSGVRDMMKLALGVSITLVLAILLFGRNLIALFTQTPEVIELGRQGLMWLSFGYICFAVTQVLQGVMRGAGDTLVPMWLSIITTVILRMPLAYLLAALTRNEAFPQGSPQAIFASLLISWVMGTVLSVIAYRKGKWKKKLPEQMQRELQEEKAGEKK